MEQLHGLGYIINQDIVNKHMPIVQKKVKRNRQPKWMNQEIQDAIHTRDFLKKTQNTELYRVWRNKVVSLIREAKKNFYVEAIESNKKNPTVLWQHLKDVCPDKQEKSPNILQIDENNITDSLEIANALNSYFTNVPNKYLTRKADFLDSQSSNKISSFVNKKTQTGIHL